MGLAAPPRCRFPGRCNPSLDQAIVARAIETDRESAEAEWLGGFRSDIAAFLDDATIDRVVDYSRPLEVPPRQGIQYAAFVDPSGGRHDAFTLGVGHREGTGSGAFHVCDVLRGRYPPFDPVAVVAEYAELLKAYRVHSVVGDNYSAAWAQTAFEKAGVKYIRSELNKSQLYIESLPLFMRQCLSIPNHPKLVRELRLLERRTSRMGRDVVDHGANGSDDHANALAGLLHALAEKAPADMSWISGDADEDQDGRQLHAAQMLRGYLRSQGVIV